MTFTESISAIESTKFLILILILLALLSQPIWWGIMLFIESCGTLERHTGFVFFILFMLVISGIVLELGDSVQRYLEWHY